MAKGQKRSSREPKKPKQNKPKTGAAKSTFSAFHAKPEAQTSAKKNRP